MSIKHFKNAVKTDFDGDLLIKSEQEERISGHKF